MSIDPSKVAVVVLSGGKGTRLWPLTALRCKPAVPFAGSYRLIDIPLSNSIHSGFKHHYVITQFLSWSLHRHLMQTYRFDPFSGLQMILLSAEQKGTSPYVGYQGTADAVRQNLPYLKEAPVDYFLILSADQLYKMDFAPLLAMASEKKAALVMASHACEENQASRMGLLRMDRHNRIVEFTEKPQQTTLIEKFKRWGRQDYWANMGIYLFRKEALFDLVTGCSGHDFGQDLLPIQIERGHTYAYPYQGYWEDVGTIGSYFKANMDLTCESPSLNLFDDNWPFYGAVHRLPASSIHGQIRSSLISDGCQLGNSVVERSILGARTRVEDQAQLNRCIVMGTDRFDIGHGRIGPGCVLQNCILDKNVVLEENVKLINRAQIDNLDADPVFIRDGIIIVKRGAHLPAGFEL